MTKRLSLAPTNETEAEDLVEEMDPLIQALLLMTEVLSDIHQEMRTMRIAMQEQIKYNSYHK